MRYPLVCLVAAALWGSAGLASAAEGSVPVPDQRAIERVITSQLDAFRRDAGEAAFGLASPGIQAMFGDAPHFMAMVRQAYPPVYRSRSAAFDPPTTDGDRVVQPVTIVGADGMPVLALYTMEREADGTWRIDGCTLTRPRRLST